MKDKSESLQQRHEEWIETVNRGNAEAYAGLLTEDVVWLPPGGDPLIGREAFRVWLEPFLKRFEYDFTIENERFRIMGDWAIAKGEFTSVMTEKEEGETMKHSGSFVVMWRWDDGDWYIDRYIDDTDLS